MSELQAVRAEKPAANNFEKILDLVNFLADPKVTTEEITRFLTLHTFTACDCYAVYICQLLSTGEIELIDSFGLPADAVAGWKRFPLTADVPSADSIREDRMIWLSDPEEWDLLYPQAKYYPGSDRLKTLVNTPLYMTGAPVGGIGVMCADTILPTPERIAFLDIVAGLVSLHLSRASAGKSTPPKSPFLTFRQKEVLRMLSLQFTNSEIANQMGYSLSTIRQETMRIYEILQVANRREAVEKAFALGII